MASLDPYNMQRESVSNKPFSLIDFSIQATGFEQSKMEMNKGLEYVDAISDLQSRINILENELKKIKNVDTGYIKINILFGKYLNTPMDVILESDEDGFIARLIEVPLYGYGEDQIEAVEMLKSEIESTYRDLNKDNEFSSEWLTIKQYLTRIINQ